MKKTAAIIIAIVMLVTANCFPFSAYADSYSGIDHGISYDAIRFEIESGNAFAVSGDTVKLSLTSSVTYFRISASICSRNTKEDITLNLKYNRETEIWEGAIPITDETVSGYWILSSIHTETFNNIYTDIYIASLNISYGVAGVIGENDVSLEQSEFTYCAAEVTPKITVTNKNAILTENVDYDVTFNNNKNAGTASVTVRGINCFEGEFTKEFKITPKTKFRVKLSDNTYIYNGKEKKPAVTVYDGKSIVDASNYTVSYSAGRKNVGKYPITVTMKNNYSGTKTVHIVIKPQGTSITKVNVRKGAATICWKKQAVQTTGYQLQYSTDSNFNKNTTSVILTKDKTEKTVKNLKSGKKYYFRIRTYTKVKDRTIYSVWSKTKNIAGA